MRLSSVVLLLVGCAKVPEPAKYTPVPQSAAASVTCPLEITFDAQGKAYRSVFVAGEFNKWKNGELQLTDPDGDFLFTGKFDLPNLKPGRYAYKIVVDQGNGPEWVFDTVNTRRKTLDKDENSLLIVKNCALPTLSLVAVEPTEDGAVVTAQVTPGSATVEWGKLSARTSTGEPLALAVDKKTGRVTITASGYPNTKIGVWLELDGADPLYVPVWTRRDDFSFSNSTLYFAFTDRFSNGDTSNDEPSACLPKDSPANWLGGDWAGLTQKIEEGYFEQLGIDALWISAPNENPHGCYNGDLGKKFTAYHAYFPVSFTDTEPHFGSGDELRTLVDTAHAHGIRVLIDFVANHLHDESPVVTMHKDWFHTLYICGWDQPITCWFQPYLPDINYDVDGAVQAQVDSALHWIRDYDLDGFRVDAAKHIGHGFVHTLRAEIAERIEHRPRLELPGLAPEFYMVGETYTGGWSPTDNSQVDMIREWVSREELYGQFDFPMWIEVLQAFGKQSRGLSSLKQFLLSNVDAYGKDALMSSFVDNHDVPRFISHADALVNHLEPLDDNSSDKMKVLGWSDNRPAQPQDARAYLLAEVAYGFIATQPHIPLTYYGDEIGLPGAGDPDNRRMMAFTGLLAPQQRLLQRYGLFNQLRKAHPAMRSKTLEMLGLVAPKDLLNDDTLAYLKRGAGEEILVVIDRRFDGGSESLPVFLPSRIPAGTRFVDLLTQAELTADAGVIDVPMARPELRLLKRVP